MSEGLPKKKKRSVFRDVVGYITLILLLIFVWYLLWGYKLFEEKIGRLVGDSVPASFKKIEGNEEPHI